MADGVAYPGLDAKRPGLGGGDDGPRDVAIGIDRGELGGGAALSSRAATDPARRTTLRVSPRNPGALASTRAVPVLFPALSWVIARPS